MGEIESESESKEGTFDFNKGPVCPLSVHGTAKDSNNTDVLPPKVCTVKFTFLAFSAAA